MYTKTTAIHFIPFAQRVMRSLSVRARHVQMGTLGVVLILAMGCGGGGSSGGQDTPAAIASTPVDLPPGQTTAALAWEPSVGDVTGYYILESRSGSAFAFSNFAGAPEVEISGGPGDRVRIQVIALARTGTVSAPSPPSVEMRFHAAVEAEVAAVTDEAETASAATLVTAPTPNNITETPESPDSAAQEEIAADTDPTDGSDVEPELTSSIDQTLQSLLLGADVRFPFRSHSPEAAQWLQSYVDAQIGGGLSLVGTGQSNPDAYRELIFSDQSGQLFVSDGAALAVASMSTDFVEAIRLRTTERFAGLADFDGDGVGDWLIEDSATFEVWMVNGETQETIAAVAVASGPDGMFEDTARLAGHGDFDGDGRAELLWSSADGSFQIARATTALAAIVRLETATFDLETSRLLTVADLNGDGRDDLLFRDANGRLQSALSAPDPLDTANTAGIVFVPSIWSEQITDGLELLATLDVDGDGRSEIAWHNGVGLELWDASGAP